MPYEFPINNAFKSLLNPTSKIRIKIFISHFPSVGKLYKVILVSTCLNMIIFETFLINLMMQFDHWIG